MRKRGISILLSYIALTTIVLIIGGILTYFFIHQMKVTSMVMTSELEKEEMKLLERISLVYWGKDYCILSNDGETKVKIKKIYVDNDIIDKTNDPIIIDPYEKKEIIIPYGRSLIIETSYGNLMKFIRKEYVIMETTITEFLPSEKIVTSIYTVTKTITSNILITNSINQTSIQTITNNSIHLKFTGPTNIFLISLYVVIFYSKFKMKNNKGISNLLSYVTLSIVILIIGFSIYSLTSQQFKHGQSIIKREGKEIEYQLLEKISLIYWGNDGIIISNDGEKDVIITKFYVDNNIIDEKNNPIIIKPNEKKQIPITYGNNLMIETSSGNLIKFERVKPIIIEVTNSETVNQEYTTIENSISYLKTIYTSTLITTILETKTSYKTTTSTSYSTTTSTSTYVKREAWTTSYFYYTYTITLTIRYTLTFLSPYTTYKIITYTTIIDPIILKENNNSMFDNFPFLIFLFLFIVIYSIFKKVIKWKKRNLE